MAERFNHSEANTQASAPESLNFAQMFSDARELPTGGKVAVAAVLGVAAAGSAYLLLHGRTAAAVEHSLVQRVDAFAVQLRDLAETGKSPYTTAASFQATMKPAVLFKPYDVNVSFPLGWTGNLRTNHFGASTVGFQARQELIDASGHVLDSPRNVGLFDFLGTANYI